MARTWLSIEVELIGGRGEELWPRPGRIFAVGPEHTFQDFADAINTAFARWDRAHLDEFTLADGTRITGFDPYEELAETPRGPIILPLDITEAKVFRTVNLGDQFQFVFDLGDNWTHHCTVHSAKVDPMEVLGIRPAGPLPYWGGGNIPDQYGRRSMDDDGETPLPSQPADQHPMFAHQWPPQDALPGVDLTEVDNAIQSGDAQKFLASITKCNIDDALHHIAAGAPLLLATGSEEHSAVVFSLINRLSWRNAPGDRERADELLQLWRNTNTHD